MDFEEYDNAAFCIQPVPARRSWVRDQAKIPPPPTLFQAQNRHKRHKLSQNKTKRNK